MPILTKSMSLLTLHIMKKYLISLLTFISLYALSYSQVSDNKLSQIDNVFSSWNTPGHPGGTVGIMKDGQLIYCKSYGLASLEFLVPNTNSTRYNIASVSKQFTAYAILLLEHEGKLSTADDIHTYLPWLPDFGKEITIEHMIHHTSGMRSLHSMLQLAGWRGDDLRSNEDLVRFMMNQQELNFEPGSEYMYCNTGYILLSELIEEVTGCDFAVWMKANVFDPMGMYSTYVEDQYNRVVTQNATSYSGNDSDGFVRSVDYWGYVGSGNIHSSVEDLLKWNINFYNPPAKLKDVFKKMEVREILNNGDTIRYAYGVNVDKYKGNKRISHSGSIGGYRAFAETFPDEKLSIVILTNFSSSSPSGRANKVADIILPKIETVESERLVGGQRSEKEIEYKPGKKELKSLAGEYFSPELKTSYFITYKDNKLRAYHNRHGYIELEAKGRNKFGGSKSFFRDIDVIRKKDGAVKGIRVTNSRVRKLWFEKRY